MKNKYLIVIVGATAVGKTALSIKIAQYFHTEILSADSRQFYKELNIGTAKPSKEELAAVPHHFIDSHHITEEFNVGDYEKEGLKKLEQIFETKNTAVLTGGSGLYIKVLCEGIDEMPETKPEIRAKLQEKLVQEGLESLVELLKKLDFDYYQTVDKSNTQRVIRALEVCLSTGLPFSSFRTKKKADRPFQIIKIGIDRPREVLYERIDQRMDAMLSAGLLEEVKSLEAYKDRNALQTVGYQEIFDFLEGKQDWEETVRLLKRNSRRYAKRQMTWFRKDTDIRWFDADSEQEIITYIEDEIKG